MTMFPKPGPKKKKKATRELVPLYIRWVHGFACVICGNWPVHAHHATTKGAGGSDMTALPLCFAHHVGDQGIHYLGKVHFQAKFRIDLDKLVGHYNALYNDGAQGPHSHKIPKAINLVST